MKKLPIGISDFKHIVEEHYWYADKTLLIKELLERGAGVTLLPRPRRFGKTLNLSMLNYFFSNSAQARHLFDNTAIARDSNGMAHQGQYPVILLTFKDVKVATWQEALQKIQNILSELFARQDKNIVAGLSEHEQRYWEAILHKIATKTDVEDSLKFLSQTLERYYGKKVVILLDEYDAPIHAAFKHGYYQEMVGFIRNFLSGALKDNTALQLGVLTGILRMAKEGIFSGLNNLTVHTILDEPFSTRFGFTESEVEQLLADYHVQEKRAEVKEWYNGYRFAGTTIYNPWSLLNCIQNKGSLQPYWANTSDNALIMEVIARADATTKHALELLMMRQVIYKEVDASFVFSDVEYHAVALWSLLLFAGYLTPQTQDLIEGRWKCNLAIPNKEIYVLYKQLIERSFDRVLSYTGVKQMQYALAQGDGDLFEEMIQKYLLNSMSIFDLPNDEPEKSYHLFVLGLLVTLGDVYEVISNRESGYGRYDIMLVPKDVKKRGVVIEFKRVAKKESLEQAAEAAVEQIREKQYTHELRRRGITTITGFGIAFQGKEVLLQQIEL